MASKRVSVGERMKRKVIQGVIATVLFMGWGRGGLAQNPQESQPGANRVIEVMAKKYEFSPDEIHVKKGEKV